MPWEKVVTKRYIKKGLLLFVKIFNERGERESSKKLYFSHIKVLKNWLKDVICKLIPRGVCVIIAQLSLFFKNELANFVL